MRSWELASLVAFVVLALTALARAGRPGARLKALTAAAAGLALTTISARLSFTAVVHEWVMPLVLLLLYYWGTGALFAAPMRRIEDRLIAVDAMLRVRAIAASLPSPVVLLLEIAYTAVYPTIPIALWLAIRAGVRAEQFWSVVLITDYICFGCLPWIQTRPPRAIEPPVRPATWWRRLNEQILAAGSVRVNTVPSGHAAEALACALLLVDAPQPIVLAMFVNAAAISAGAVFGRYHYTADVVLGWTVAAIVWVFA